MTKVEILTKNQMEKKLKALELKLSNKINTWVNTRLNEVKKEESLLEKTRIEKQAKKDEKEWSMVKNKEERLLALEQMLSSFGETLNGIVDRVNELTERFNKHVDKNNEDFEKITKALKGEAIE